MTNTERISANNAELRVAISMAESISGGGGGVIEPLSITENGTYTAPEGVDGYSPIEVNVPMPEGTLEITANGLYPVAQYAEVDVSVPAPEGDSLDEFLKVRNGSYLFYQQTKLTSAPSMNTSSVTNMSNMFRECSKLTQVPLFNTGRVTDMSGMFHTCSALTTVPLFDTSKVTTMETMFFTCEKLTTVPLFDTSNVTKMGGMFHSCKALTSVPLFDTSQATVMSNLFFSCGALTTVPLFDTSKVTNMSNMFNSCGALTTVPLFDTSKVTNISSMFSNCGALITVPAFDCRSCTNFNYMVEWCPALTEMWLRNIKANLQVSNGTSYGHLLTVDSLTHLIYELRRQSSAKTLTIGSANLEKLANVYVKAIDITDEMRAEDDLIDEKYPFVVCESTDEGAMLITSYASTIKNWTIK